MNITPEQLFAEAGRMALEIRFKDQVIAQLEARVAQLEAASQPSADKDRRQEPG
jgi:hypothetical protein